MAVEALSAPAAFASRSKRSLKFSWENFSVTMRSRRVSRAFQTSPIPPAPAGPAARTVRIYRLETGRLYHYC